MIDTMMHTVLIERPLIEYILNALWQIPLLAVGAWFLLRTIRPSPRAQHRVWLGILCLALLLPMHGTQRAGMRSSQTQPIAVSAPTHLAYHSQPGIWQREYPVRPAHQAWLQLVPTVRNVRMPAIPARCIAGLYLALVFFGLFRIARAWRATQRLVEHSRQTILSPQNLAILTNSSRRLKVKPPQVRESRDISSPVVIGIATPILLLPKNFAQYSEDEIQAVLCHELAHIQRHDYLVNLLCEMAAIPVAWHPVTQRIQQRIGRTREMVCDALAAEQMQSELTYAKCLVALANGMLAGHPRPQPVHALGLFSNNTLEERVMQLVESKNVIRVRARVTRAVCGVAAMMFAITLAFILHVAPTMAQSTTAAQPQAAQAQAAQAQPAPSPTPSPSPSPDAITPEKNTHGQKSGTYIHPRHGADERPVIIINGKSTQLTPEERRRIDKEMADAQRQVAAATAKINSPEFKQQIQDAERQAIKAQTFINSKEMQAQMADAQRQVTAATAKINSPEFKQQIQDAERQAIKAQTFINSKEMQAQMADAQRQVAAAMAKLKLQMQNTETKQSTH
ncbi:MAG TPA: M56 family metallopeptidase [Acidobacteriaceae bacterium]|nr:M56 family metallopeptidase [Acidobacteriaceae bacterium]